MTNRILILAPHRAGWPATIDAAAAASPIPLQIARCRSVTELYARLDSGRRYSAAVIDLHDERLHDPVRRGELLTALGDRKVAVIDIRSDPPKRGRTIDAPGSNHRVIAHDAGPAALLDALIGAATPIPDVGYDDSWQPTPIPGPWAGRLLTVCGSGGTGVSTVATALTQGCASVREPGRVVLADLARHSDLAIVHGLPPNSPTILELCRIHRTNPAAPLAGTPIPGVAEHGPYEVIPGLRRAIEWTLLDRAMLDATLTALVDAATTMIAVADADVEGDAECGSWDVEDRNLLARTAHRLADTVVVVASPGRVGIAAAARLVDDLVTFGVPRHAVVVAVNRVPVRRDSTVISEMVTTALPWLARPPVIIAACDEIDDRPCSVPVPIREAIGVSLRSVLGGPRRCHAFETPERVAVARGCWPPGPAVESWPGHTP